MSTATHHSANTQRRYAPSRGTYSLSPRERSDALAALDRLERKADQRERELSKQSTDRRR